MSANLVVELLILAGLVALSAFFSAAEIAVVSVRRGRLRQMMDEGVAEARLIQGLADNSSRLLSTVQVGSALAGFFAAATAAVTVASALASALAASGVPLLVGYASPIALVLTTLVLALVVTTLGELVPKNLALLHNEAVARLVARPLLLVARLFDPLVAVLSRVTDVIVRLLGGQKGATVPFVTEEEIKTMVDAGEETGVLEEREKAMIYGVFDLGERTVREVMVPRIDVAAVEFGIPLREAARIAVNSGYSRLPVYEGSLDHVIGILHAKDLLAALSSDRMPDVRSLLRPPYFVPESKRVDDLLREMQSQRIHLAVVVDEYGGTDGIVTLEDVLEVIVGEIRDEHDRSEVEMERIDERTIVCSGRVTLEEVNQLLDVSLQAEDVDTIGGYVTSMLERVPVRGDRLDLPELVIEVIAAAGRRAKRVRVTRKPAPEDSAEGE